jgi:hypothetical protein
MNTLGYMIGHFIQKLVWNAYQVPGLLYFRLEKRDQRLAGLVFEIFEKTKTTNVLCKLNDIVNGEEEFRKAA